MAAMRFMWLIRVEKSMVPATEPLGRASAAHPLGADVPGARCQSGADAVAHRLRFQRRAAPPLRIKPDAGPRAGPTAYSSTRKREAVSTTGLGVA